jgi:hypothetical protein
VLEPSFRYGTRVAKHTWYNNCWYRSKLEARWAIFFDELQLTTLYEPRTFGFRGRQYTPDFWIADWKCYVEIKPINSRSWDIQPLRRLARLRSKCAVLLIMGQPSLEDYEVRFFRWNDTRDGSGRWVFGEGRKNRNACYLAQAGRTPVYLTGLGSSAAPRPTTRPLFRRGELKRLSLAYANAECGPPLIRGGHFIIPDSDCPWCKDMSTSPNH